MRLKRAHAIKLGAGAAAAIAVPGRVSAASQVTLCLAYPQTGVFAAFFRDSDRGVKMALSEANNMAGGYAIKYITRDTQANPGVAVQQVTDAIEHDDARYFMGEASSAAGLAIEEVAGKQHALFLTSVGADEVTGSACNMYTFRWSVPTYGAVRSTMYPFVQRNPGAKRWYTITPSYVFGDSLLRNVKEVAQEKGLTLVGNATHPLGASDFSSIVTEAIAAKPDVIALLNFGGDSVKTIKTLQQYGAKKSTAILYVWSSGLSDFQALGSDALEGLYVGCQFWHDADAATRRASEPYMKAYGEPLGYVPASAYIEAKLTLDAINRSKSADPLAAAKALQGYKYVGPTGPEMVRAYDHQVIKPYYFLRGKAQSAMKNQWDYVDTLASSSYPVPQSENQCKLT